MTTTQYAIAIAATVILAIFLIRNTIRAWSDHIARVRIVCLTSAKCAMAEHDAMRLYASFVKAGHAPRSARANTRAMIRNRYHLKGMYQSIVLARAIQKAKVYATIQLAGNQTMYALLSAKITNTTSA